MQDLETGFNPLSEPVNRLLGSIESFDGGGGRSAEGARQVRNAMQHLFGVCKTEWVPGSEQVISLIEPHIFASGWSSQLLGNIHKELQFIVE